MNEKKGPNGFLLGLLIGGAIGALLSTKRGRQILKDIAEYGLEYVGNSMNIEDIETILNEEEEEMMSGEMDAAPTSSPQKTSDTKPSHPQTASEETPRRRLFRGIRKK